MLFSYNWLQNLIKEKLPQPQKLAELLTMHSFEVEDVKKTGKDFIFNVDILPNRGSDCLNHLGLAREISAILKGKVEALERKKIKVEKGRKIKPIKLKISSSHLVPRYSAILVEGVKVKSSPPWLKEKLKNLGLRSVNNIVDLTNFIMLEIGQPLHVFDYDKIKDQKIIIRLSKKGESLITLDEKRHILDKNILVIEDKGRLIDLVGIMGGRNSEVDENTENIVLQAGKFDRQTIYQGTKKLNFTTQAANIYFHDIDPNLTIPALERAYFLLQKLSEGRIVQLIDVYPKKTLPQKINLNLDDVEGLLGIKLLPKEIIDILKRLEFKVSKVNNKKIRVEIPTWRLDISIPEDLIEEIGRISGFQKIPPLFPVVSLVPPKRNLNVFWENFSKDILKTANFSEVYNRSFFSKKEIKISGFKRSEIIEVENPVSLDYQYLRPSLIPHLLNNIEKNQKNFQDIRIFELGKIFILRRGSTKGFSGKEWQEEKRMLTGAVTGDNFYELKGIIDLFFQKMGIANVWYDSFEPTPEESKITIWNPQKCAEIKVDNTEVGFLGEIKLDILQGLKIKEKVVVFDLNFEKLQELADEEHEYRPFSRYPAAIRDLALLVPKEVKVADVLNVVERVGGEIIRDIDLFDVYEGKEIVEGKKNLAFHLIYQSEDKTLTSKEIDIIQEKIIKALEKNLDWEVRK